MNSSDITSFPNQYYYSGQFNLNNNWYNWNAKLPIPQENVYIRFKYVRKYETLAQGFFQKYESDDGENYIELITDVNSMRFNVYNNGKITQIINPNFVYQEDPDSFRWIGLFITKDTIQFVYDNEVVQTVQNQGNTLKYFSGIKYHINSRKYDSQGRMRYLKVYHDLDAIQFNCLKKGNVMKVCSGEQCPNQFKKEECLKKASNLYEVNLEGQAQYDYDNDSYTFTLQALDLDIPDCVHGYIYNGEGQEILNYEGPITNPSFSYDKDQIENTNNCYQQNGQQLCQFKYVLQVYDSIKVVYNIKSILQEDQSDLSVSNNVRFEGQFQENFEQNLLNKIQNTYQGITVNRDYQIQAQKYTQSQLVFYTSFTFEYPLNDLSYSYGSNIYAQVQVDQLDKGYKIEFNSAKITVNNEDYVIAPSDISYSDEGYLNLTFETQNRLQSVEVNLTVNYLITSEQSLPQYKFSNSFLRNYLQELY